MASTDITIYAIEDLKAEARHEGGYAWLNIRYADGPLDKITIFMDPARAERLAAAINAAWVEPVASVPVLAGPTPAEMAAMAAAATVSEVSL